MSSCLSAAEVGPMPCLLKALAPSSCTKHSPLGSECASSKNDSFQDSLQNVTAKSSCKQLQEAPKHSTKHFDQHSLRVQARFRRRRRC